MCFRNTSQIQPVVVWDQERSETQLHTGSVSVTTKMLGFTRFLFDVTAMEQVDFSIVFQGFGGIRSTQPTELLDFLRHKFHIAVLNGFFSQTQVLLPFRFIKTYMNAPNIHPVNNQPGNISNIHLKSHSPPSKTLKTSKATHRNPP